MMHRILLVFVDGLGLGPDGPHNPLATVGLPDVEKATGVRLVEPDVADGVEEEGLVLAPLDAVLGIEGVPQSGTGQTAIYTGRNAQRLAGRHVPALPGGTLRELLERDSIFRLVDPRSALETVAFANAFTSRYLDRVQRKGSRMSAALRAARAAGVRLRDELDLMRGHALSWDLTGEHFGVPLPALRLAPRGDRWRGFSRADVDTIDPSVAAARLLGVANDHRLTVFETYLADLAGHGRFVIDAEAALEKLDSFLGALLRDRTSDLTVVVTSDHGNLEDRSTAQHTLNRVPLLVLGPAYGSFAGTRGIDEVRWRIENALGVERPSKEAQTHG